MKTLFPIGLLFFLFGALVTVWIGSLWPFLAGFAMAVFSLFWDSL